MFLKKSKTLIYIILLAILLSFITPVHSLAEDSVYVWSNNSSTVSTSIVPSETEKATNAATESEEKSR